MFWSIMSSVRSHVFTTVPSISLRLSVSSVWHILVHVITSLLKVSLELSIIWWVVHGLSSIRIHAHSLSITVVSLVALTWTVIVGVWAVRRNIVSSLWWTMLVVSVIVVVVLIIIFSIIIMTTSSSFLWSYIEIIIASVRVRLEIISLVS